MRVGIKIVVDFTGCIHLRHPYELGGLYYSLTLRQAQVGSAVFAQLYVDTSEGDAEALGLHGRRDRIGLMGVQLLAVLRSRQEGLCGNVHRHTKRHPVERGQL